MADRSAIEWTEATWNPVTGCTKVSPGCDHCYAERLTERFHGRGAFAAVRLHRDRLTMPLRWRKPRRVFVNSMSDLFHPAVPDEYIVEVFAVMALARQHTFQVLTKRHGRMRALLNDPLFRNTVDDECCARVNGSAIYNADVRGPAWPLPNVWLGVSVEDQRWADIRIPALLDTPAAVRFISCEPLLGPVDLRPWLTRVQRACDRCYVPGPLDSHSAHMWGNCTCTCHPAVPGLDWVIVGGESGPGARPMHPDWARTLRDQCTAARVAFFFKQWGGRTPKSGGRELDGRTWDQFPEVTA